MNYAIKSGDLVTWKGRKGFINNIIRLFTLSEYTHVGIAVVEDDDIYVVEAVSPCIRKIKLSGRTPFQVIPMNVNYDITLDNFLNSIIGRRYSMIQAILSFFNIYIDDDNWYCTELGYEFYSRVGVKFDKNLTPTRFIRQAMVYSGISYYIDSL